VANVDEVIFPEGTPAIIACSKCKHEAPVIVMESVRRPLDGALIARRWCMPEGWTRIEIHVTEKYADVLKQAVVACANCTIEIA
jgi:hypothetical protein